MYLARMTTKSLTDKDSSCLFNICFHRDSSEEFPWLLRETLNFLKSIKPDSVILGKKNKAFFVPHIEEDIAALLFNICFETRTSCTSGFAEAFIGVNFRQKVKVCYHSNSHSLLDLLIQKYRYNSKRVCYSLEYEEIRSISHKYTASSNSDSVPYSFSDTVISLKQEWAQAHVLLKYKYSKHLQDSKKKRSLENIRREEILSKLKTYFGDDHVIRYIQQKKNPSVQKDKKSESKQTDQVQDTVPLSGSTRCKAHPSSGSPTLQLRKRKKRRADVEYRKSCPEFKISVYLEEDKTDVFSDPETLEKVECLEKDVSLNIFHDKDGDLKPHVRKHLQQITNLPLRRYPVRQLEAIVFPGRRKKNERPTERRHQRGQAQGPTVPVQPTEDPNPERIQTVPQDSLQSEQRNLQHLLLPTQSEQRGLQHLLSTFTPTVEPISASTQQLRRLAARPRHPQYTEESARRESFADWPSNTGQNPENMVTNGFFYTGRIDLIRCFMCGIGLKDWSADDESLFEHVRHSPDCPFLYTLLGQDVLDAYKAALLPGRTQPTGARDSSQNIQGATNRPEGLPLPLTEGTPAPARNPQYEDLRQRIDSFNNWPRSVTQTPRQLAEAGFFHTGDGDTVRCFHCDGGLRRWDPRDDPWIEHTRWFPHCAYVRQVKGVEYVELVQRAIRETAGEDDEPFEGFGDTVGALANLTVQQAETISEPTEPVVTTKTILDMGYTRESLSEAMKKAEGRGMVNYTPADLLDILLEMGSEGEINPPEPSSQETEGATSSEAFEDDPLFVAIENKSLKKVLKCSECKVRDKNILFLPCTHHCLCEQCAEKVTKCPICDKEISRKIKTYLS